MSEHHEAEAAVRTMGGLGVRAVRLLYTDLHGVARGKDIPIGHFGGMCDEGVAFCAAVMGTDLRHTPVVGGEVGYVDFAIKPDLDTLRAVPWQPEVAWCLGEAWTLDGAEHWPSCPRALLRRVVDAYAARGLTPIVAPELEFFLAERDPAAENGLRRYVDELSRVYTVGAVSDPREIVLKMLLWCDDLGLQAFAANHEFMNSQYEINVKHSGALEAADRAFMLKAAVKEIAVREGLLATFMGRPFADQGGSGFHVHLSLNGDDGKNAFADDGGPEGLSPLAAHFIAGVIEHAQGLQALLGPTINAYKRILPDSLAPTHANWGHDNRTAFCRVPNERGSRARVEIRTADGSACPHLITAALLLAGLDGIERELTPPDPVVGDAYRLDDAHAGSALPASLGDALDALEADTVLTGKLGDQLVSTFLAMKRFEVERFSEAVGDLDVEVVSQWEIEEYASHLSAKGRCVRVEVAGEERWGTKRQDEIVLSDGSRLPEAEALYLAPASPSKILAVHLTYGSRVREYDAKTPPEPSYFMKPPTTLNGHRRPVPMAKGARFLNYEGELAVIVGERMKGVPIERVLDFVGGYTCANDIGMHDFRHADRGAMLRVKGHDGFLPLGPELVPAAEFDPTDYTLRTYLNGEVVQEAKADDLLFTVAYQLADLCRLITLEPGDLILTGTPANSRPMKPGDVVEVEISGIGRLTNTIEEWDVDLAGPGEQMQVSAQTLHVALAIPEDEAERMVAEGREP